MKAGAAGAIEQFLGAMNASDWSAALEHVSEDVAFDALPGERSIGREDLRWWMAAQRQALQSSFHDIAIMTSDDGSRGAAEFTLKGLASDGEAFSLNAGMFFSLSGGRIERITCCNMPATRR